MRRWRGVVTAGLQQPPEPPPTAAPLPPGARAIAAATAAYALVGGTVTLFGWFLERPSLVAWAGAPISMKANAATCAVAAGASLLLLILRRARWATRALAALVCLIGSLTLIEHLFGVNLGIDTLLAEEPPGASATAAPGRMGPPASVAFTTFGSALWLAAGGGRSRRVASALGIVTLMIALLPIVGYLYAAGQLFAVSRLTGIALQTATMIAGLGAGMIAAIPEHGLAEAITRRDPGGVMFRRLALPILVLSVLSGVLRLEAERQGVFDTAFGTAARTIFEVIVFLGLLWWTAEGISRQARAARQAEQALREADRRKDQFLATLAHELRNPLAPMRSALELAALHPGDVTVARRAHATMERQLAQMVHLVDDLLDVSRISRGRIELRRQTLSIGDAVESAVETCRPVIDGAGHDLTVELPPAALHVDGDPTRLSQIIANLLNNAARYTPPGGRIRVIVDQQGNEVRVRVRDTGVGIPADVLPDVFEVFAAGRSADGRAPGGLGIGLALVKQLVELHGGRAEAHSPPPGLSAGEPPSGTEMVVCLPLVAPPAAPVTAVEAAPAPTAAQPLRILVADDNVDAAEMLALLLEALGHRALTASDGARALEEAQSQRPDVAFVDIGMPVLDGHELCRRIRAEPWGRSVVMVAVTGWGQAEDRNRSSAAGFDHHLVKPATRESVQKILASVRPG